MKWAKKRKKKPRTRRQQTTDSKWAVCINNNPLPTFSRLTKLNEKCVFFLPWFWSSPKTEEARSLLLLPPPLGVVASFNVTRPWLEADMTLVVDVALCHFWNPKVKNERRREWEKGKKFNLEKCKWAIPENMLLAMGFSSLTLLPPGTPITWAAVDRLQHPRRGAAKGKGDGSAFVAALRLLSDAAVFTATQHGLPSFAFCFQDGLFALLDLGAPFQVA